MIKIDKLWLKLFIFSWAVLFGLMTFTAIFFNLVSTPFTISLPVESFLNTFTITANMINKKQGLIGLEQWVREVNQKESVEFFLLDVNNNSFLIKPYGNSSLEKILKHKKKYENDLTKISSYVFSKNITNNRGQVFKLVANAKRIESVFFKFQPVLFIRFFFAFLIGVLLSFSLTFIIYRRIKKVRIHVNKIKQGDYHVLKRSTKQFDEICYLEDDVISMANTISQLIESKNRLLQDISHELRSPLSRQLTAIELYKAKHKLKKSKYFEKIEKENAKIESLVSELLEFSKMNQVQKQLHLESFDLHKLMQDVINDTQFEFNIENIKLHRSKSIKVTADKGLLQRSLENIVRNSAKYAGKHGTIEISLKKKKKHFYLLIEDNGPGVSEQLLPFLFEPFYRGHSKKQHNLSGYGLGLSIAKQIISLHQGTISAHNRVQGGLLIKIVCPIHQK